MFDKVSVQSIFIIIFYERFGDKKRMESEIFDKYPKLSRNIDGATQSFPGDNKENMYSLSPP